MRCLIMKSALLDNIRPRIGVAYSKNIKRFRKKGRNVAFVECHQRSIIIKKPHVGQPSYPWAAVQTRPGTGFLDVILFLFFASSREAGR